MVLHDRRHKLTHFVVSVACVEALCLPFDINDHVTTFLLISVQGENVGCFSRGGLPWWSALSREKLWGDFERWMLYLLDL